MEVRRLGGSGLQVSRFSLGSWVTYGGSVDEEASKACLLRGLELGVNFIDAAEAYAGGEAERVIGRALRGVRREEVVLSSKVFWGGDGPNQEGLSRKRVMEACHAALKRLQTDYLDLYFCHRPDPSTPIEETVRAMDVLIYQGKVLYWGTSEWAPAQVEAAYRIAADLGLTPPTMEQPEYNLFRRKRVEEELRGLIDGRGLGLTTFSPLAGGLLSGKYARGVPSGARMGQPGFDWLRDELSPRRAAAIERLRPIAAELSATLAQVALAWCARDPRVSTVITGASSVQQLEENLAADDLVDALDAAVLARLDAAVAGTEAGDR